jgi:acetyl-CoA acetyltransferase
MGREISDVAAFVGVGHSDWRGDYARVRAGEKPFDAYGYGAVALSRALKDAGLKTSDIDGLIVGQPTAYERSGELYGINPRWGGQADAMQAVLMACMAIRSGMAEVVALVFGMDQRSAGYQYGGPEAVGGASILSYVYHAPWGLTSQGALYSLMYRRHMELTGATERDLGQVAVAQRQWANRNPHAVLQKLITIDDYLNSVYIADPLHLYDYCMINDGGVALIISEVSRAKRMAKKPVRIRAAARFDMNEEATTLKPRLIDFYHPGHHIVADDVYGQAGLSPKDIDVLNVYDSFSCHIPFALEGFGFCREGEAGRFIAETGIGPGGKLPINTGGGHLSESYMQGWNHQIEAVRRVRGDSEGYPIENCRHVQYISDVAGKVYSFIYGL